MQFEGINVMFMKEEDGGGHDREKASISSFYLFFNSFYVSFFDWLSFFSFSFWLIMASHSPTGECIAHDMS